MDSVVQPLNNQGLDSSPAPAGTLLCSWTRTFHSVNNGEAFSSRNTGRSWVRYSGRFIGSTPVGDLELRDLGEQGWRSGESARLPPMCPGFDSRTQRHMWTEFVGSLLCSERFFSRNSGFPLSSKTNT